MQTQTRKIGHVNTGIFDVCVVGLGYVGFPLAQAFSKVCKVAGLDNNQAHVEKLKLKHETNRFHITQKPQVIRNSTYIIITVPTPVTESQEPDLSCIISATRAVSENLSPGSTVILESTVYPGVTEKVIKPILEESGLKCGEHFKLGYSPERINPGDEIHSVETVIKVVSGMDEATTEDIADLYGSICSRIYKANSIMVAEAAKVIENTQRDINIAFVNELSMIFSRMGIKTSDVLDAASTKWNFIRFSPGLVGGHCIPVDPYYLAFRAKQLGHNPKLILAGRETNNLMPEHVAKLVIQGINRSNKVIQNSKVLILGLTYKENVPDVREAPVKRLIEELDYYGIEVIGFDPLIEGVSHGYSIKITENLNRVTDIDCVILNSGHEIFRNIGLEQLKNLTNSNPVLVDIRDFYDENKAIQAGFSYFSL